MNSVKTKPFYELLDSIFRRPGMFNVEGIRDLKTFITGYSISAGIYSIKDEDLEDFGGFTDFVASKFEITSSHDWSKILSFYSASSSHSLELFELTLKEFKNRKK